MSLNTEPEPVPMDEIRRALENRVWDAAESIAAGISGIDAYTWAALEAYARGCRHTIDSLAERFLINICTDQLQAAVGERMSRNGKRPDTGSRACNKLLEGIRAKRIAVIDKYEAVSFNDPTYKKWQRKIWALERKDECDYDALEMARKELRALHALYLHLMSDRGWWERHWETKKATDVVANATSVAVTEEVPA